MGPIPISGILLGIFCSWTKTDERRGNVSKMLAKIESCVPTKRPARKVNLLKKMVFESMNKVDDARHYPWRIIDFVIRKCRSTVDILSLPTSVDNSPIVGGKFEFYGEFKNFETKVDKQRLTVYLTTYWRVSGLGVDWRSPTTRSRME